jgi:predicted nucleic acid-binding protein
VAALLALDTNVYIHALRNPTALARLKRFMLRAGTRLRVSAVVAMELRAGARSPAQERDVEAMLSPYDRRGQVVVPSFDAFVQAGRVVVALATRERMTVAAASLGNDAILAASCREAEVTLVTANQRDFSAIQRHLRGFRFSDPEATLK